MLDSVNQVLSLIVREYSGNVEFLMAALIAARTAPMIVLTPFLGGKLMPPEVKMGMIVSMTVLVWMMVRETLVGAVPITPLPFLLLMLKEAFVGFTIGFVNAHVFFALNMAGRLIDTVRGTSMSEVQDPHSKQRVTPTGDLYTQLFLVIFVVVGGHRLFLDAYFASFERLPINKHLAFGTASMEMFVDHMMHLVAELVVIAVIFAAPVAAATFISDVVFGILNRVAPQLNAYFMSMPIKAWGGVIMLFVALDAVHMRFYDYVVWTLNAVEDTLGLLAL